MPRLIDRGHEEDCILGMIMLIVLVSVEQLVMTERETLSPGPARTTVMAVIDSLYISPGQPNPEKVFSISISLRHLLSSKNHHCLDLLLFPIHFSFEKMEKIRFSPFNYARLGVSACKVNIQS